MPGRPSAPRKQQQSDETPKATQIQTRGRPKPTATVAPLTRRSTAPTPTQTPPPAAPRPKLRIRAAPEPDYRKKAAVVDDDKVTRSGAVRRAAEPKKKQQQQHRAEPEPELDRPCRVELERVDLAKLAAAEERRDGRLRKERNGMVLLPRSAYNRHPAKRPAEPLDEPERPSPKRKAVRESSEEDEAPSKTYRLVFSAPANRESEPPKGDGRFALEELSDSIEEAGLPSELWEVERVPPKLSVRAKTDSSYDTIAAELEAIMGEQTGATATNAASANEYPSIMDILDGPSEPEKPKADAVDDRPLTNVIFRRLTRDKQAYDRLVTFDADMKYLIAVDDARVELIGAPKTVSGVDDVVILLQIVDDIRLTSFNVAEIAKSRDAP